MTAARPLAHVASRASDRIAPIVDVLASLPAGARALVLGPTREVADELARRVAQARGGASFGVERSTLHRLAADLAAPSLAARGQVEAEPSARRALARRVLSAALADGTVLPSLAARSPGFPRALAETLDELRLAGVSGAEIRARAARLRGSLPHEAGRAHALDELAALCDGYQRALNEEGVADRADVLAHAIEALSARPSALPRVVVAVDLAAGSAAERRFVEAIAAAASRFEIAVPSGDADGVGMIEAMGAEVRISDPARSGALAAVQRGLFAPSAVAGDDDGSVRWIGAPGETREAVEIARQVLAAAREGIPLDAIAIAIRTREVHGAGIESALARAGIPAWFEAGTRRPHPSGRAFLTLLACAREGLSASRFAEFLSLGEAGAPECAIGIGRWERLLREAAVVGGRARWERRLRGLSASRQAAALSLLRSEPDAVRAGSLARDAEAVESLLAFALPIVDALDQLPIEATLPEWAGRLEALASLALREPGPLQPALTELRAFAGPALARSIDVEAALEPALRWVERPRPARRQGCVLVTTPDGLRGRAMQVVLIPGLAERLFPPPRRDDPLLPDEDRDALGVALAQRPLRTRREHLRLAIAVGAADRRLVVSYPRMESETGRPRVPSLYALEILRARDGVLPDLAHLARDAARTTGRVGWPAPRAPDEAIDSGEHDLAVLARLLDPGATAPARGRARYLLQENHHLARTLRARFARWGMPRLGAWDGVRIESKRARDQLAAHRLGVRAHAPSGLRLFAMCPYRFFLHAVLGLREAPEPVAIERLDPLARGELHHLALARVAAELAARGWTSLTPEVLGEARLLARRVTREVAEEARDRFAVRVDSVFDDDVDELAADVEGWVKLSAEEAPWAPHRFDLAFGLPPGDHIDSHSSPEPARVGDYLLRGAIDAIERNALTGELRVTDFKTGSDDTPRELVIGRGEVLQPVLYAMALEAHARALGTPGPVGSSRLLFASARGGFRERSVGIDDRAREAGMTVLRTVDAALERGILPALPRAGACEGCSFRKLCGPDEERRARGKTHRRDVEVTSELGALRARR